MTVLPGKGDSPPVGPWLLEPGLDYLNHGSFGACPRPVLDAQTALREQLERDPVDFFQRAYAPAYAAAKAAAADVVGADPAGLAFVKNATTGTGVALAALDLGPGDEILVTDHEYGACLNAARIRAEAAGASVTVAAVPFPVSGPDEVVDRILSAIGPKTRAVLVSSITSPTGLVFPAAEIVAACRERGVASILDAAHAPGQTPMDLTALRPDFATGNFHKWCCAPKGCAFVYVDSAWRDRAHPPVVSHGAGPAGRDGGPFDTRFDFEFAWCGTDDPTAWLTLPAALRFMRKSHPEGLDGRMTANRQLAVAGRDALLETLGVPAPAPDSMIAAMAAVPLPDGAGPPSALGMAPLQAFLRERKIQVPISSWPAPPRRLIRISAQAYNREAQYARLARLLKEGLDAGT